jgi:anti-sigma-K factor RskA
VNLGDPSRRERLDALAAQFALGTLPARARRRLAAAARRDGAVAAAIADWEDRLSALAVGVTPVVPAPRVWTGIRERLGLDEARASRPAAAKAPWWTSLGWWRALATLGFVMAVAFGIALFAPPAPEEQVVVVLAGPDATPALIATADRASPYLTVKAVTPPPLPPGRALELWMLPQGQDPRSLGLIPATGVGRVPLPAPAGVTLQGIPGRCSTPAQSSRSGKTKGRSLA